MSPRSSRSTASRTRRRRRPAAAISQRVRRRVITAASRSGRGNTVPSTCSRCQSSSISRHQSRCPWSARPEPCSSQQPPTAPGLNSPARGPSRRAGGRARASRSSSRNQRPSGTPNPVLPRVATERRENVGERAAAARPCPGGRRPSAGRAERAPSSRTTRGRAAASAARASAPSRRGPPSAAGRPGGTSRTSRRCRPETPPSGSPRSSHAGSGYATNPGSQSSAAQLQREDLHQPPVARLPRQRRHLEKAGAAR